MFERHLIVYLKGYKEKNCYHPLFDSHIQRMEFEFLPTDFFVQPQEYPNQKNCSQFSFYF